MSNTESSTKPLIPVVNALKELRSGLQLAINVADRYAPGSADCDFGLFLIDARTDTVKWVSSPEDWPYWLPSLFSCDNYAEDVDWALHQASEGDHEAGIDSIDLPTGMQERVLRFLIARFAELSPRGAQQRDALDAVTAIDDARRNLSRALEGLDAHALTVLDRVASKPWRPALVIDLVDELAHWPVVDGAGEPVAYPTTMSGLVEAMHTSSPVQAWTTKVALIDDELKRCSSVRFEVIGAGEEGANGGRETSNRRGSKNDRRKKPGPKTDPNDERRRYHVAVAWSAYQASSDGLKRALKNVDFLDWADKNGHNVPPPGIKEPMDPGSDWHTAIEADIKAIKTHLERRGWTLDEYKQDLLERGVLDH